MERKKTFVEDINRSKYDIFNDTSHDFKIQKGLTKKIVTEISTSKKEPKWMLDFRLKSLEIYNKLSLPTWGPDLSELDMDEVITYVKPHTNMKGNWEEVPEDIKNTFKLLGIPEAERESLAGVGAQYDSEVVYHSIKEELLKDGVIYTDMDTAIHEYRDIIKEHFMKLLTPNEHKFSALHGAVWSGGSFVYVPKGVEVKMPLQSYFRVNSEGSGQFEHTLIIVEKGAKLHFIEGCSAPKYNKINLHAGCVELFIADNATLRYSTIENWSKNMMNLNSKRATVGENGAIEWISGTFGSHTTMLYPMSILKGKGSRSEFIGVTFASEGQNLDTGTKVIHAAPNTSSTVMSKSISKNGGKATYRSSIKVLKEAINSKASVICESLMMDSNDSRSDTIPIMDIRNDKTDIGHEAKIGRISEESIFYLMSRGIIEEEAKAMIVRGFVEPIAKELPLEYAVEMNRLINLELEGSIG